jgi:hypothetical protein
MYSRITHHRTWRPSRIRIGTCSGIPIKRKASSSFGSSGTVAHDDFPLLCFRYENVGIFNHLDFYDDKTRTVRAIRYWLSPQKTAHPFASQPPPPPCVVLLGLRNSQKCSFLGDLLFLLATGKWYVPTTRYWHVNQNNHVWSSTHFCIPW